MQKDLKDIIIATASFTCDTYQNHLIQPTMFKIHSITTLIQVCFSTILPSPGAPHKCTNAIKMFYICE